jgi:arginine repressor
VAVAIDRLVWPDIIGTIAVDDTMLLAAKYLQSQRG